MKRKSDKRKFWQTIKRNVTEKALKDERITLADNGKIISEGFNEFDSDLSDYPVLNTIESFSHYASVLKIKAAGDSSDCSSVKFSYCRRYLLGNSSFRQFKRYSKQ